ncbi:hypothetical protein ZWY2020_052088 [Hordeum vulgare]|nr:hypothetical protein ZWY2020_052088 [Hordeum vulgare]
MMRFVYSLLCVCVVGAIARVTRGGGGAGQHPSPGHKWSRMWSPTLSHNSFDHHVQPNLGAAGEEIRCMETKEKAASHGCLYERRWWTCRHL